MLAVIDEKSESAEDLIVQTGALLDIILTFCKIAKH